MTTRYRILGLGASYGSLLAAKLLAAGHEVKLACLPAEAELINDDGIRVRIPAKGRGLVEVHSRELPGRLSAATPATIDPEGYDLVALAMQEPQYGSPGVRELMAAIARANVPCMSIMNMPPPPYLARIPGASPHGCDCYTDESVWDGFDPQLMTLCSPDAQAFRPPEDKLNVLQVRLPTNFKAAPFASSEHTSMLRTIEAQIDAARFDTGDGEAVELPVKLRVHDSLFVPLAKWSMLLAGNYRCVREDGVVSIREAVHGDLDTARAVYEWVGDVCRSLGASDADLVPFEKYANAALSLQSPSSAARAIANGATHIERVDRLVQAIAQRAGMKSKTVDRLVSVVDARMERNRHEAEAHAH